MFILRTIHKDLTQQNHILGSNYQLIRKSSSEEEFNRVANMNWPGEGDRPIPNTLIGFVLDGNELGSYAIHSDLEYWIMTGEGQTFCRIR